LKKSTAAALDDAPPLCSAAVGDALDLSLLPDKCAAFVCDYPSSLRV
jgi:hypothetical protein